MAQLKSFIPISGWESQINDLLQLVNDEKEARVYLQALTAKVTEEVESFKQSAALNAGATANNSNLQIDKGWSSRRSNKVAKMEMLDLQRNLQSEMRAKQQVSEELTKIRAAYLATQQRLAEAENRIVELTREAHRKDLEVAEYRRQIDSIDATDTNGRPISQISFFNQFVKANVRHYLNV